jgi:iron complex outermembrane recepter protein
VRNTTSYSDVAAERLVPDGFGNGLLKTEELTNELLLNFKTDKLKGVVGLYILEGDGDDFLDLTAFELGGGNFIDEASSRGVFGEATYSPTDRLHLTAGARFQEDKQRRVGGFGPIGVDFDLKFDAFLPKVGVAYDVTDSTRVGFVAQRGYNPGGETFSFESFENERFKKESVDNYELYLRSRLADGSVLLNANVFYADTKDAQRVLITDLGGGFELLQFVNIDSRTYGLEADLSWRVSEQFEVGAAFGYNRATLRGPLTSPASQAGNLDFDGNLYSRAPKVTANLSFDWLPIDGLRLGLSANHSGGYFSDEENEDVNRVDSFTLLDANASYERDAWRVFLSITNLTDEFKPLLLGATGTIANVTDPREIQVGVQFRF